MPRAKRSKVYQGQSADVRSDKKPLCTGLLTIRLEGPAGCGKSLVRKVLAGVLGLLPLDTFVIVEKETDPVLSREFGNS